MAHLRYALFSLFLLGGLLSVPVLVISQSLGYAIDGGSERVSFHFKQINNLIVIPIVLNDSAEMQFILDTGVKNTILTAGNEKYLDVAYNRPVRIAGLGESGEILAYAASNVKLQLPGITGLGQTLIVLDEDYLDLDSHLGEKVHGIIGFDFFSQFVVKIDYISNKITVYNPATFENPSRYTSLQMPVLGGRPFVSASFKAINGKTTRGSFLLDTGASHSMLIEPSPEKGISLPEKTIPTVVGWGLSGQIDGKLGRIESVQLGPFSFKNTLASYGSCLQQSAQLVPDRIGSIGGELLNRFLLIFDYPHEKIYLKKNVHYKRSFEHNKSGMDLVVEQGAYHHFKVVHVMENSPASEAGLLAGDQVVAVNGKGAGMLSLEEINGLLRSDQSTPVHFIIQRNHEYLSFTVRLRRLI